MAKDEKKQVGIRLPVDLWWRFKAAAMKERKSAGELVQELIENYLDGPEMTPRRKRKRP